MRMMMCAALVVAACGATTSPPVPPTPADLRLPAGAHWDVHLIQLLPQIDACIADARGARQVTFAGAYDDLILVRLSGPEHSIDCRIATQRSQNGRASIIVETSGREQSLVVEGENEAIFVRGPGENPGGECYEAPEVRDANGSVIGWMLDPQGC
jgi:hypothetical protein